jgi:hypothetical protein
MLARTAAAWIAIAVHATTGLVYPAGVVLCVADDGHVAVETVHETARCTADFERHHPETAATDDPHAHPCTDTFISQPLARSAFAIPACATLAPALVTWNVPEPAPLVRTRASATGASPPPALAVLRSVVILA